MAIPKHSYHKVRLNLLCRADIAWWSLFISQWNGVSLFPSLPQGCTVVSDASGSWGSGVAVKELIPVIISAGIWGKQWHGTTVEFLIDNMAVVHALTKGTAQDPHLSHLLCCLLFLEATCRFEHRVSPIPGKQNVGADALSHNNLLVFMSLFPQAPTATPIPPSLLELLFNNNLSWTSPTWTASFHSFLAVV